MGNIVKMESISVPQAKLLNCGGEFLRGDLALFTNFEDVPLPLDVMRMDCLFLALCTSGQASYTVDTKEYIVRENDMMIITEGQVVGDYMLSRDCKGICIMVSNEFYSEIIKDFHELSSLFLFARTNPVVKLTPQEFRVFQNYFQMVRQRILNNDNPFLSQLCCALLRAWLYELGRKILEVKTSIRHNNKTRAEVIFTEFIQLVERNFRERRKVNWYAGELRITPKYLSEIVKTTSSRTPNEWIDQYVTLEMRVLLKNSTMNIKEIADFLHFPNQSFFGKYFKEHVGQSPSEYRRSLK